MKFGCKCCKCCKHFLSVSQGWQQLSGYTRDEALGRPLSFLQGPLTEPSSVRALMSAVCLQSPVSVRPTNTTDHTTATTQPQQHTSDNYTT